MPAPHTHLRGSTINPGPVAQDTSVLMAVMAHPDDAELWMGATIAQHAHDGGRAIIVLAHDAGEPRLSEGRTGAEILGADVVLVPTLTVTSLAQALTEARPDVLVTHPLNDIHPGTETAPTSCNEHFPTWSSPPATLAGSTTATDTTTWT